MTETMRVRSGPRPILDEREYIPNDRHQARQLFDALVDVGVSPQTARGILGTLLSLPDLYSKALSVKLVGYRKELQKLGGPPWESPSSHDGPGAYSSVHRIFRPWRHTRRERQIERQSEMLPF